MHKTYKGFTLLELVIILVIIITLASIAYTSYHSIILKSHRADAITSLLQDQAMLERCYAQNFSYLDTCALFPTLPHKSYQGFYVITLTNLTTTTYMLTASAIGNQQQDLHCLTMGINQSNSKVATSDVCWII